MFTKFWSKDLNRRYPLWISKRKQEDKIKSHFSETVNAEVDGLDVAHDKNWNWIPEHEDKMRIPKRE
jgi:hypothetical protein